jgi:predicted ATPase
MVLDNCEHVIEAAAALAVDTAPGVRILATSREPLRTEGEHVHRLSPCESPPTGEAAFRCRGFQLLGRLFVERRIRA